MSETKFTPGPWTYVPLTDACRRNPLSRFCIHTSRLPTDDEREANARLMATSPEMYEALDTSVWALSDVLTFLKTHGYDTELVKSALVPARAALDKAAGR